MKFEDWINNYNRLDPKVLGGRHRDQSWEELAPAIKKSFPWAEYIVEIDDFRMFSLHLIKPWCEENLIGKYDVSVVSYFEFEEDSILFTLRWA